MTEEQPYQISRYIREEMTPEEMEEFQKVLETDPDLLREFNLRRLTEAAIYRSDFRDFKKKYGDIFVGEPVKIEIVPIWRRAFFKVAAAAAIVLIGSVIFVLKYYAADSSQDDYSVDPGEYYFEDSIQYPMGFTDELEIIDALKLPVEKFNVNGSGMIIKDTFEIGVLIDTTITAPLYNFNGYYLSLYLPNQQNYRRENVERILEQKRTFFLFFEKRWYMFSITSKDNRKRFLPVSDPLIRRELPSD